MDKKKRAPSRTEKDEFDDIMRERFRGSRKPVRPTPPPDDTLDLRHPNRDVVLPSSDDELKDRIFPEKPQPIPLVKPKRKSDESEIA